MAKDYYDDMEHQLSRQGGRDGSSKPRITLILTIILGIVICVAVIVIWYLFSPESGAVAPAGAISQPAVAVRQVEDAPQPPPESEQVTEAQEPPAVTPTEERREAVSLSDRPTGVGNSLMVQYADHRVVEGEDLPTIAALYGLQTQTLISINQIKNIQAIREGSVLRIPDRDGRLYTVREGDMLSSIARNHSPSLGWKTLQELNGLKSETITVGQQLFIPDTSAPSAVQLVDRAPLQFQRPTEGRITTYYGQVAENPATGVREPLMGILIQGSFGQAVVAAAAGQVVDAWYEKQGKGRFVTLSHEGGYRTTYCHLENVDVQVGMSLPKGGVIGSIGTSGTDWTVPTLFFSIEQSGLPLDPNNFF